MINYEVGQAIEKYKNYNEGVRFDLSDDGAILYELNSFRMPIE